MARMETFALSLGGNVGDVPASFAAALRALAATPDLRITAVSDVWRTPPWGKLDQPDFRNMAVAGETMLSPRALLQCVIELERLGGRRREERWGPRTLDLDILLYGERTVAEPDLEIPHPRMAERAFVLVPLAELIPETAIGGETIARLAQAADRAGMVRDDEASRRVRDGLSLSQPG